MKAPPITGGNWRTEHKFPGRVVTGEIIEAARGGLTCRSICRVEGRVLPEWKHNLKLIAAAPKVSAVLNFGHEIGTDGAAGWSWERHQQFMEMAKAVLLEAGYTEA